MVRSARPTRAGIAIAAEMSHVSAMTNVRTSGDAGDVLVLALTMGEPAGIGPEIAIDSWSCLREGPITFAWFGDPALLASVSARIGRRVAIRVVESAAQARAAFRDALPVVPIGVDVSAEPGSASPANAHAVLRSIDLAVAACVRGEAAAMVTNPIQKAALYAAGFRHPGHTEYLGEIAGGDAAPTMMLACPDLRVVPVTIHLSLREAIARLTTQGIIATARTVDKSLRREFGIAAPRLAVAGLNPHAGERDSMGTEDSGVVAPAVAILRGEGIDATGPLPPDTMFTARARRTYDAAICMYHDQALIPLKTLDVDGGVNVTLGLSVVRTSPDHGTALDIAGRGIADPSSLVAAIRLAAELARNRAKGAC
jgi:4-hydroxythreonine-4-phosphate dehydrogenase